MELVLIADTELLTRSQIVLAPDVRVEPQEQGVTLLYVAMPANVKARRALAQWRQSLCDLNLLTHRGWHDPTDALQRISTYTPIAYEYLITKDHPHASAYLGFGSVFVGPSIGRYRVVRVPNEHLSWQCQRLASGLHLSCATAVATYDEAVATIATLNDVDTTQ